MDDLMKANGGRYRAARMLQMMRERDELYSMVAYVFRGMAPWQGKVILVHGAPSQ